MQTNFTEEQLKLKDNKSSEKIFKKCVHCGMCNATCPTFNLLGDELDGPRGRIYLIQDMLENEKKPTAKSLDLMRYLKNNFKYYIDWCGSLFWIEVLENENNQIKEIRQIIINLGGYLTVIKKSESLSSDIDIFTINDTRLLLSKKIKESFDPKKLLNPGKMYRGL